jgi:YVTN family beta-propeller protein
MQEGVAGLTRDNWLNAVEGFFAELTRRRLQRGIFRSVDELKHAINRFIAGTNVNPKTHRLDRRSRSRPRCCQTRETSVKVAPLANPEQHLAKHMSYINSKQSAQTPNRVPGLCLVRLLNTPCLICDTGIDRLLFRFWQLRRSWRFWQCASHKPFNPVLLVAGLPGILILLASPAATQQSDASPSARDTVKVEFSIDHTNSSLPSSSPLHPGEIVKVRFKIQDKISGTPLDGLHPAAWLDLHGEKEPPEAAPCKDRVRKLLNANFLFPPEIDLNGYYVVVMNNDATVKVVDPQFSSGSARVVATIPLESPGKDWQLAGDEQLLFVAMPLSGKVAVIDTASWRVTRRLEIGPGINRLRMQPDGRRLWVAYGEGTNSGVAFINVASLQLAGKIQTGSGPHDVGFSGDGHAVFVTNAGAGTVSVIDTADDRKTFEIRTGRQPEAVAFSDKSGFVYVTDSQDGTITVVDGAHGAVVATIHTETGVSAIRFARDGRFGIVLNLPQKHIYVLDSSSNRLVQTGDAEGQPDQVTFSGTLAYVRQRASESVLMIPLDSLGAEHKPLPQAEFPGGQHPPGQASSASPADSIVQVPGENAVLVANPPDHSVYYYKEGMAAPMGFFSDGPRQPIAVLALGRSLKGNAQGVYETTTHLKRPGLYTMALLLDSPPAVQCWDVVVEPDPAHPRPATAHLEVQGLLDSDTVDAGVPTVLHVRIWDSDTQKGKPGAPDVKVRLFRSGGWHQYSPAKALEEGVYEAPVPALQPGVYYLNVVSASLGLTVNSKPIIFRVVEK